MKRLSAILLPLILLFSFLFSGCQKADVTPIGFEIVPGTVTPTGLTYRITQKNEGWTFGDEFWLEKQDGEAWSPVPRIESEVEIVWNAVAYALDPGQSKDMNGGWSMLYGELEPGHYRIGKRFHRKGSAATEDITLYAEFDILEA